MRKLIGSLLVVALMPVVSMAADAGKGTNLPGSDSCGMGWQITQKKTWLATTTRGTTNYFIPPAFGMTSGTMGCDQHSIAKNDMDAAKYASNNQESLSIEMAQGEGEYLAGFAKTLGCEDAVQGEFAKMAQDNYGAITANNASGIEMLSNVKAQIKQNAVLAGSCRA